MDKIIVFEIIILPNFLNSFYKINYLIEVIKANNKQVHVPGNFFL